MSIKYVVLGYLSWKPMTGYDLKKVIAAAETLPWSASSNQIYHALLELHRNEWVSKTVHTQTGAPNRHVYSITDAGRQALKQWAASEPQPPQAKKPFLHQLMWADGLTPSELDQQLEAYQKVVGEKLFFMQVQADRKKDMPQRTAREVYLWEMIHKNWIKQYEVELDWIRKMRQDLQQEAARGKWIQG